MDSSVECTFAVNASPSVRVFLSTCMSHCGLATAGTSTSQVTPSFNAGWPSPSAVIVAVILPPAIGQGTVEEKTFSFITQADSWAEGANCGFAEPRSPVVVTETLHFPAPGLTRVASISQLAVSCTGASV